MMMCYLTWYYLPSVINDIDDIRPSYDVKLHDDDILLTIGNYSQVFPSLL